jgi:hypothetical protein
MLIEEVFAGRFTSPCAKDKPGGGEWLLGFGYTRITDRF